MSEKNWRERLDNIANNYSLIGESKKRDIVKICIKAVEESLPTDIEASMLVGCEVRSFLDKYNLLQPNKRYKWERVETGRNRVVSIVTTERYTEQEMIESEGSLEGWHKVEGSEIEEEK